MELWIRSQDKEQLRKIVDIKYQKGTLEDENVEAIIGTTQYDEWEVLGQYATKERTLEVLDDIQSKLKQQFIVRPDGLVREEDKYKEEARLNYYYNGDFIMKNEMFKIEPINAGIIVYEMPKE